MRRIRAVAYKEWLHLVRDRRSLVSALSLPVILLLMYGYAVNFDLKDLPWAVVDHDQSALSRDLLNNLQGLPSYRYLGQLPAPEDAERLFQQTRARAVLVIPAGLERTMRSGGTAQVQLLVDGSEGTTSSIAQAYLEGAVNAFGRQQSLELMRAAGLPASLAEPAIEARLRVLYNPDLLSRVYLVPGLIGVILMLLAGLLTSGIVVRERERGTFELLASSPISARELLIGKLIPYVALEVFDVVLCLVMGWAVFGVGTRGSLPLLMALSAVFILTASSMGLFFSCVSPNQQTAMLLAFVATVLPTMILSGFAFPVRNMPLFLQVVANLMPATHFIAIVRGIMLRGVGIAALYWHIVALIIIGAAWLRLAVGKFHKTL